MPGDFPLISIITPAYNETGNLLALYDRLCKVLDKMPANWEWILIDDHSSDDTFAVLRGITKRDNRVRGIRLARNFGSHIAITCGLHHALGDCATIMAADLQDPPEAIPELFRLWQDGNQVIWAVRARRDAEKASTRGFSRLYYLIMRNVVGIKELPPTGADLFMLDRQVIKAFTQFKERNTSIFALITWMGFRQATISYDKQPRVHGQSGWNFSKKFKLVIDSITSFSYLPLRLMAYLGFGVSTLGFLYALFITSNALAGKPPQGWASLMVVTLVIGGIQMLMMGMLGEYLWRTLDEARGRPQFIIEATVNTRPKDDFHKK